MKPFYRILPKQKPDWEPIQTPLSYAKYSKEHFEIVFTHFFNYSPFDQTFFALCEPFSYLDCQNKLSMIERKLMKNEKIYFARELLTLTVDGRKVDLLTFTSFKGLTYEREAMIEGLFPTVSDNSQRPYKAKKPVIFLSARVHPGEVPGSHIMNGVLDYLANAEDDPCAMQLLNNFTIKIVPMLNPDGVARGHYRLDNFGQNLNRMYENPHP